MWPLVGLNLVILEIWTTLNVCGLLVKSVQMCHHVGTTFPDIVTEGKSSKKTPPVSLTERSSTCDPLRSME